MRKKIFVTICLLSIALLSACTSGEKKEVKKEKNKNVITMIGWYDEDNMSKVLEAVEDKLDGEYTIDYSFVNLQQYNNVLSTQLASGEGPDVVMDGAAFPARIKSDNLIELNDEKFLKDFSEEGLSLGTDKDGSVYGIPSYGWYSGVWYNKEIFNDYGLEAPETFEEFLDVSKTLKEAGVNPIGFGLSDGDSGVHSLVGYLENTFYQEKDNDIFDTELAYGEKELSGNWNSSVNEWMKLIKMNIIDESMLGISNDQNLNAFINGEIAMINSGPWHYNNIKDAGFDFGMFSHLGIDKGNQRLVGGPAANMGINKNTKNIEGAKVVLEALASDEVQMAFLESNPGGFSYKNGVTQELAKEYELISKILDDGHIGNMWDRLGINVPSETFLGEFKKQVQNLVSKSSSSEEFLEALDLKIEEIRYE